MTVLIANVYDRYKLYAVCFDLLQVPCCVFLFIIIGPLYKCAKDRTALFILLSKVIWQILLILPWFWTDVLQHCESNYQLRLPKHLVLQQPWCWLLHGCLPAIVTMFGNDDQHPCFGIGREPICGRLFCIQIYADFQEKVNLSNRKLNSFDK